MLDRIGYFFLGVVFFLYLIIFAVNKNIKIGEKYIKFDDAGILWVLPAIVFLIAGIYGFYFAFRSKFLILVSRFFTSPSILKRA